MKIGESKEIMIRFIVDIGVVMCALALHQALFKPMDAFERGFFCDDESLMYPFKNSTVSTAWLYVIGWVVPPVLILFIEIARTFLGRNENEQSVVIFNRSIPDWLVNSYKNIIYYAFGATIAQLVTDIGKNAVGRLRPHFFDVCKPIMSNGFNCSHPDNMLRYVQDYSCTNADATAKMIREIRLSFPSGHASMSSFALLYIVFYLQTRVQWGDTTLVKKFVQALLITFSLFVGMSRIFDFKHHWSDVVGGLLIGYIFSFITAKYVAKLFDDKRMHTQRNDVLPKNEQNRNTILI